jgi:hypothetical protein
MGLHRCWCCVQVKFDEEIDRLPITKEESMFTAKIEVKDLDKMDAEYRELLGRVLTIQADCEIGGPISTSRGCCRRRRPGSTN